MTMHAYQETYLTNAQSALGDMFDYAINIVKLKSNDFINMFLASSVSIRFEKGDVLYIAGKSGIEMLLDIIVETKNESINIEPTAQYDRSCEYWIGWALAYYQWNTGRKFKEVFSCISFEELQIMYQTLHEADITKFVDILNERIKEQRKDTNLKRMRQEYGITQSELAAKSGVSIRSIQMYEQRNKNINKASVETIRALAMVLGCDIEDLIEA